MKRVYVFFTLLTFGQFLCGQEMKRSESISINGNSIYYEVYGQGEPLLLLHGYTLSSKSWQTFVSDFSEEYEVYLIDLPGHGRSDALHTNLSLKAIAGDIDDLVGYLGLKRVKAIGFSFGGDILYQLALMNPILIESMITIGSTGSWDVSDFPGLLKSFSYENRKDYPWLEITDGNKEKIQILFEQFKNYRVYISDHELGLLRPEVLVVYGDDDESMDLREVARAKDHIPKSDIWIIPNVGHGAHEGPNKALFVTRARAFLSKR